LALEYLADVLSKKNKSESSEPGPYEFVGRLCGICFNDNGGICRFV